MGELARGSYSCTTLAMARRMRDEGPHAISPSRLYESAARESREHYSATPALIESKTRELYTRAMIEAGALIQKRGRSEA